MDTLRGNFDGGFPADESQDWDADTTAPEEENLRELPPEAIGQDERRMQVRAYNHWASLLGEANFPSIEDLQPEDLNDFGPNSVLLDFSAGIDDPVVQFLGDKLADECGAEGPIERLSDVPPRSLLSRITDHYMQILANQAPIGFEAEFVNQRGSAILYRGILLPYSSDDETIDFIFGVINWKEMADAATADELLLEIDQAIDGPGAEIEEEEPVEDEDQPHKHHVDPLTEWADSPSQEEEATESNVAAFVAEPLEPAPADDIPTPDFGLMDVDLGFDDEDEDEDYSEYGEYGIEEEGDEDSEAGYSFASLADYIETPAKKAVDLDADRFDPEDYKVEEPGEPVVQEPAVEHDAEEDTVEEEMAEDDTAENDTEEPSVGFDFDDTLDLGGLEAVEELPEEEVAAEPEPVAVVEPANEGFAEPQIEEPKIEEPQVEEVAEDAGLYDCLASARELAQTASASEDRSRQALYAAVGRAYDFSLAAEAEPEAYHELIEDSGLTVQDRAPMTPIVKLVFGHDYDKTRLTEYAAVLTHAHRVGIERGTLASFLSSADGGLKGVVNAERRLRREEAGKVVEDEGDIRAKLAQKLRELDEIMLEALSAEGPEFSLVMVRRDGNGKLALIGEIADDVALIERAGKRLVG